MRSQKDTFTLRLINTLLFATLFLIQYNASFSIKIFNISPLLPLSLLVAIGMFCSELRGTFTGLIIGILIDAVANTPPGFNTIVFCVLGLLAVLVTKHLFNNNIISAITLCVLCSLLYFLLRWIFCYAFSLSFTENLTYVINTVIPSCVFTAIFIIPFYYLEKSLYKRFYKN